MCHYGSGNATWCTLHGEGLQTSDQWTFLLMLVSGCLHAVSAPHGGNPSKASSSGGLLCSQAPHIYVVVSSMSRMPNCIRSICIKASSSS